MRLLALISVASAAFAAAAVAAPPATLTLASSAPSVLYGTQVKLTGVLSTKKANQPISIMETACGSTRQTKATTVKTVANGVYTATVMPTGATSYQATFKGSKSPAAAVSVRPLLELKRVAVGSYTAKATAGQALTGKFVLFQRYRKLKKRWVQVKRIALGAAVPGTTKPAMVSSVSFKSKLAKGTRVRVMITNAQAAPCYVTSASKSLRA
jgi:hypothetical protein